MTRSAWNSTVQNANRIMLHPPAASQLFTVPQPAKTKRMVYFFTTSQPDINSQTSDLTSHKTAITAIGLTAYPFRADFPQGAAQTREAIDHTQYILTAESAGTGITDELSTAKQAGTEPFLVLGNYNNITNKPDPVIVDQVLATPASRSSLAAEVTRVTLSEHLAGVTVDFENVMAKDRQHYILFMQTLHQSLLAHHLLTMICLPEKSRSTGGIDAYDYAKLGQASDLVMLITYDEHVPGGKPGPIAALFNDDRVIKFALQQIPPQKILLGVADYGYDWSLSSNSGVEVSMAQTAALAQTYHAKITLDPSSQTPTFSYTDTTGAKHVVWSEDRKSLQQVMNLVNVYGLKGISVWHLGAENQEFWDAVQATLAR